MSGIIKLDTKGFDKALEENETVLIDFFAEWCGPCKMLTPILEQVVADSSVKAVIAKVDIDESLEIAKRFGVMSVPTMIVFNKGEEKSRLVGLRQKVQILDEIKKASN